MKKIINRKTYNTETSETLGRITFGAFGDDDGFEEILMQTKSGNFFIYGIGGPSSKYTEETIVPLTAVEMKAWKKENNQ